MTMACMVRYRILARSGLSVGVSHKYLAVQGVTKYDYGRYGALPYTAPSLSSPSYINATLRQFYSSFTLIIYECRTVTSVILLTANKLHCVADNPYNPNRVVPYDGPNPTLGICGYEGVHAGVPCAPHCPSYTYCGSKTTCDCHKDTAPECCTNCPKYTYCGSGQICDCVGTDLPCCDNCPKNGDFTFGRNYEDNFSKYCVGRGPPLPPSS